MQGQDAVFLHTGNIKKEPPPTPSTGGGAQPASPTSPPAVEGPEFNVEKPNTNGLDEQRALQKKLDSAGVTWIRGGAGNILAFRKKGGTSDYRQQSGLTEQEIKNAPLTEEISNNLVNVAVAGQELLRRFSADPRTADFFALGGRFLLGSSWRPGSKVENTDDESQHALGRAMDIEPSIRGTRSGKHKETYKEDSPEFAAFSKAVTVLYEKAQIMWQEGLIGGVGFYPGKGFVHIDVRPKVGTWTQWVDETSPDGRQVYPKSSCDITEPNQPPNPKRPNNQAACAFIADLYDKTGYPGLAAVQKQKNNRISIYEGGGKPEPSQPAPPPPEPAPVPVPEPPPVNETVPITLVPIDLPQPREVVGFVEPVIDDPDTRPPEASIGTVTATKGLIIAKGPDKAPAIVSTDLIQTFQFTQFRLTKDTSIRGDSPNGGDYAFRRAEFKKLLTNRFLEAAQNQDPNPESTPQELFQELWDLISSQMSENPPEGPAAAVPLPRFDPDNPSVDPELQIFDLVYLATAIPSFEDAVSSSFTLQGVPEATVRQQVDQRLSTLGVTSFTSEVEFEFTGQDIGTSLGGLPPPQPSNVIISTNFSIAEVPLKEIKSFPQFAAPSGVTKQGKKGQNYKSPLRKLAEAYAETLTGVLEAAFDGLQILAMEPGTGREDRLATLTGAFDQAVNVILDSEDFKATEPARRTIKVEKFAQIGKPIHSPVMPVSDAQGYEHFGHYRYGRGLTIDQGGSFAYLHNNDDPFGRLSATAAEELVDILTLIKQDSRSSAGKDKKSQTQAELVAKIDEIREEEETLRQQQAILNLPPEEQQRARQQLDAQIQARAELRLALSKLMQTQTGREAIEELLLTNPAPDGSVEVLDFGVNPPINATQLELKFANFAASYTNSGPFKTSVANAAYRLTDLVNHIQSPDLQACSCRGSSADVALIAYNRLNFLSVDGIDGQESPAEAFVSEQIINSSVDYFYHQRALRGEVLNSDQTPDAFSFEKLKSQIGTSLSNVRSGFTSIGEQFSNIPEQFRTIRR
jgi:hypothetical protein